MENGFAQWEEHCKQVGHVTKSAAQDQGLVKSGKDANQYAGYSGNPFSRVFCTAPGCAWSSKPART